MVTVRTPGNWATRSRKSPAPASLRSPPLAFGSTRRGTTLALAGLPPTRARRLVHDTHVSQSEFTRFEGKLKQAGYQLVKDSEGQLGYVRRLPGKAKGNEYAQLTMTEKGLIALKTGEGTRISVYSRYRKNFLELVRKEHGEAACAEAAARISQGKSQLHHLIPDGVAQKNPLIREAYERLSNYTIDRGSNMLDMPSAVEHVDDGIYVHLGSHKNYSNHVDDLLTKELNGLTQGGKILQRDVKLELIERAIKKVEDKLRNQIKNGGLPDKVVKELIEDGIHVEVKGKPVYKLAMLKFRTEGVELVA
ncbi:AHH domain-containing protein [Cystobacter ferrugineus]|uniref:AHH domain-containing protein n=1 Tax=Cystobacter ferrugineus TaxID=83449 RepID=UPI0009FE3E34|nr:AHH domain-containing protein [Cystobacter ferrugineus]